jgi:hypothetical protein
MRDTLCIPATAITQPEREQARNSKKTSTLTRKRKRNPIFNLHSSEKIFKNPQNSKEFEFS